MKTTWFEDVTGIDEESPEQVRRELSIDHDCIVCPNGSRIAFGRLETPKLGELRSAVAITDAPRGKASVREVVGDVRQLHSDPDNANALFQVASQFNLLEMTGPSVTPERGVGIYEHDHTQGPACAIACGAGTIYRNYFAPVVDADGQSVIGQSARAIAGVRLGIREGYRRGQTRDSGLSSRCLDGKMHSIRRVIDAATSPDRVSRRHLPHRRSR